MIPLAMFHLKRKVLCLKVIIVTAVLCLSTIAMLDSGRFLLTYIAMSDTSRFILTDMPPYKYEFVKPLPHMSNITNVSAYLVNKMPDYKTQFLINSERIKWVESVCEKHKDRLEKETFGRVWASSKYSMAFCIVPKNGCTYWKQVLRFLEHDHMEDVQYPTDLNRYKVHFGRLRNLNKYRMDLHQDRRKVEADLKFMFTRDPYSRIWSAYLDKFVLPDFWRMGIGIVQELRLEPDVTSLRCGHDVTFQEFVRYNYLHRDDTEIVLNEHFQSIVYNCDPCKIKFDVIGKMETFKVDSDFVSVNAGINDFIKSSPHTDPYATEIISLIDYNLDFKVKERRRRWYSQSCFNDLDIAKRLWTVFQFNGYISDQFKFPEMALNKIKRTSVLKEKLKRIILKRRKDATIRYLNMWKTQRSKYMREAFTNLTLGDKKRFQEMYSLDFELFQYEENPDWLNS